MTAADIVNISMPLTEMARLQPDTPAIIFPQEQRTLTFRELDLESSRIARGLKRLGIRRGVKTALLVPPSPELFAITFALFKAGAVPVFIDPGIGARNMKGCLAEAEPAAFIGIPKAHLARRLLGWGRGHVRILVTVGGSRLWGGATLTEVRSDEIGDLPFAMEQTRRDETAAILFTSGSTGPPKGAIYTHGTFAAQVDALRDMYDIRPGEIDLPTFPLFALFAPALGMTALIPQMDFTRPGSVDPQRILGPATEYSATTMFGSPALLNRVGRYSAKHGIRLDSLKRVISAGAPVPASVLERFAALLPDDAEIFTPYGATEALPVCSIGSREILSETGRMAGEGRGVCIGRPVDSISLAIIPISDEPIDQWQEELALPLYEVGEIAVAGPQVSTAYLNRPETTKMAKIADPELGVWHRMGDVGYLDKSGRIWFCGRKSHRVITADETLFTIPVEGVFNTHPDVFRSALVGINEKNGSKRPVLCVELEAKRSKEEHQRIRRELLEVGSRYPHTKGIREILFHPAFPVDIRHNAKIFREKLAVWAEREIGMKVLVTGGGGFLGGAIVRMLRERGDEVCSFSRGEYKSLSVLGVTQFRGDLDDKEAVARAADGCELVFHVAAKAGIWGSFQDFYQTNVTGTDNVIAACISNGVRRLVYTSSPSVVFDGKDVEGGNESLTYPARYEAHYPSTKAMAERLVLAANSPELAVTALRPHLIWGPGDNHLVPRIVAKGRAGKLRRIGDRPNLVDTVYVDNAAQAHLQAADRLSPGSVVAGKTYFISNNEPLPLWEMVNRILSAAGIPPVTRTVSPRLAYTAGCICEALWGALRLGGEPPMTRFVAHELASAHWFDISAAHRDFGYTPEVSIEEGLIRLRHWFQQTRA